MPLLTVEAQKLSNDQLRAGVLENIITSDELFALLPFLPVNGKAYVYNRENTLGSAAFVDTDDVITEDAATFTKVTALLKRIIGDVDVDNFLEATHSDVTDQASVQIATKSKVVGRSYANKLINGDQTGVPEEFDGIKNLVAASQEFSAGTNGAALSFDHLDLLIDNVKVGQQKAFIMNSRTVRSYVQLVRALGGTNPEHIQLPGVGSPTVAYRGIPILKNDYQPINEVQGTETAATTISLAALDENEGLCGLNSSNAAGIDVINVGPVQNKDATRYRVRWYSGLALHSSLALAQVYGINN
jgi:HK97 family phage major capsid protein